MNAVTKHEEQPVQRMDPPTSILSVIERIAGNPDVDVERMQALLKMRADEEERIRRMDREDREADARRAWLRDFSQVQAKIGPIVRGRANEHTRSLYADLADIERIVTPILTEFGFSTTAVPVPCETPGHIRMRLTIGHAEGHERDYEDEFPLDAAGSGGKVNKTPIQAKGSTQTYGRRYLKASALDLAFMDDRDGNAAAPEDTVTEDQFRALRDKLDESGMEPKVFHAAFGAKNPEAATLAEFPARLFDQAMARLNNYIAKRGGQ